MKQLSAEEHNDYSQISAALHPIIKNEFGEKVYGSWLSKLSFYAFENYEIILSVSSKFLRDWIRREYLHKGGRGNKGINGILTSFSSEIKKVAIIFVAQKQPEVSPTVTENLQSPSVSSISKYDNVFPFGVELNKRYTFKNFIAGDSNKLALKVAKAFCEKSQKNSFIYNQGNPLFFYGGVGLGKTHLSQAIAWHIKDHDISNKILYLSAERFMYQFVKSLQKNDLMDFKQIFRSIDTLIIDDLQFIAGKNGTQEELLCTISELISNKKKIILLCDKHPNNIENIGKKLKSILSGGLVIDFKCPDFKTRYQILRHFNKALLPDKELDKKIISLLAEKINSNVRALEGAVKKLAANHILTGEDVSFENAKEVLNDIIISSEQKCNVEKIQKIVANHFSIKISDLSSKSRIKDIIIPRQIAIYLSKKLTSKNISEIGLKFNKNHSTIIYNIKKSEEALANNQEFKNIVIKLEDKITSK